MSEEKLIVMQKDLGQGHRGEILITTQERVGANQEPIARDVDNRDVAFKLIERYNAYRGGEVKSAFWEITTFLERAAVIFDYAILKEPTGDLRNQFTDLNIERMVLIKGSVDIALYAKRLKTLLDLLVMNADVLDEMSCDDTRFGEAEDLRVALVKQLVAIMKE